MLARNSGSSRAPSGHVYEAGGSIRNVVISASAHAYETGHGTRLFDEFVEAKKLVDLTEIEPKEDRTVQRMLSLRWGIFPDYGEDAFEMALARHARIERKDVISKSGRTLYIFDRREG